MGYTPWGREESDMTDTFTLSYHWRWGSQALPFSWALSAEPLLWQGSFTMVTTLMSTFV